MSMPFLESIFGGNARVVGKFQKIVDKINGLETKYEGISDRQIKDEITRWKTDLAGKDHEKQQAILEEILPEVFAVTREAAKRTIGQRHYDVQLIGGITMHKGQIAEMKTGEGKTLTATLPLVLNALTGRGAHLVTVNDYLARWHASLMGPVYHFLGLSVASIQHQQSFLYDPTYQPEEEEIRQLESATQGFVLDVKHMRTVSRKQAYEADITYGTNNEYGFDYLRDNMVGDLSQMVQRELHYAIVDEVDSILIDEARTPLIISAPDADPTDKYYKFSRLVEKLDEEKDYIIDEKRKALALTEDGIEKLEKELGVKNIYEQEGLTTVHHIEQAVRAKSLFKRDRDYVVRDGEIVIVDEFTGRLMFGRRYSDGLHQAIEAKENVTIQQESKTLATITFQNYFRLYEKLAGMTGTALTEAEEFYSIYGLEAVSIPTHKPMIRDDKPDAVYKTEDSKFKAIVKDIGERHRNGQPLLIGTVSIQKNELLAEYLKHAGLEFELLNAKNHEHEAHIISQAGRLGAITVATNIAGRGVDILLGGNPVDSEEARKVREAGGLHVIGTERHESRRIDNQLRGRSGRQGDPGSSQFYVSMEDDLMRLFGGDKLKNLMQRLGLPEDQPVEARMVSKSIESAQKKIEGLNFDTRKHVLEYDDVMNKQREIIYKKRRAWLEPDVDLKTEFLSAVENEIQILVNEYAAAEKQDIQIFLEKLNSIYQVLPSNAEKIRELDKQPGDASMAIADYAIQISKIKYDEKEKSLPDIKLMRQIERVVALQSLDNLWIEHLDTMENLRDSVGLRGYGQRDPLVEYKREGFELFKSLLGAIDHNIASTIFKVSVMQQQPVSQLQKLAESSPQLQGGEPQQNSEFAGIGRNDPCPCGSGKKWKKCGLLNTEEHRKLMSEKNN